MKNLITIFDIPDREIDGIFKLASSLKKKPFSEKGAMEGMVAALIFEKPSNRTRVSFEVGVRQLGGSSLYLGPEDIQFGERESVKDIARVLSRYVDMAVLRTYSHADIAEFASYADMPVINGLSDLAHPCQALADIFTIKECVGSFMGKKLAYIGDGNNVLNSLLCCAVKTGLDISIATPKKYAPDTAVVKKARGLAAHKGSKVGITTDPSEAIKGADCVYTDVWVSMGQESERKTRLKAFEGFQLNKKLLAKAKPGAFVMHCLPAHRGEEITDDIIESSNSVVFEQAENRMHVQKAVMLSLLR